MSKIRGELRQLSPARRLLGLLPVLVVALAVAAALGGVGVASADEPEAAALAADAGSAAEPAAEAEPESEPAADPAATDPAPAQTLTATLPDGTTVKVEAPAGALPQGTTLEAKAVQNDAVTQAVTDAAKADGTELTSVKAIDVTLRDAAGRELEPGAAVKVTFSNTGMGSDDVSVYHVTAADGDEANASTADELTVKPVATQKAEADEQVFTTDHFSIYAIGETKPRLKVTFHLNDGTTKDIYVTKDNLNQLNTIVYDPGVGTLGDHQSFKGWSATAMADQTVDTDGMNIDEVRDAVKAKLNELGENFTDGGQQNGEHLDYYPVIVNTYKVTYYDEHSVAVKTDEVKVKNDDVTYTVNYAYSTDKAESRFDGWSKSEETKTVDYNNGDTITFTKNSTNDVNLYAVVTDGIWITYDAQASDATYTAPVFVKYGDKATEPTPTRTGYSFGGWYTDAACTNGNEFDFNAAIPNTMKNTTLYAKWTAAELANYTVNIWLQNAAHTSKYDFYKAYTVEDAQVNQPAINNGVTVSGTLGADNSYVKVGDTVVAPDFNADTMSSAKLPFHLKSYTDVTVTPDGKTVMNVYYDRTVYTLTFASGYTKKWHQISTASDPSKVPGVTSDTSGWLFPTTTYYYTDAHDNVHELQDRGSGWGRWHNYDWGYYENVPSNAKTITALYGQNIADQFPIDGYEDSTWTAQNSKYFSSNYQMSILSVMPAEDTTFQAYTYSGRESYPFKFYFQTLPGVSGNESYDGMTFDGGEKYTIKTSRGLQSTKNEDFIKFEGFDRYASDPAYKSGNTVDLTDGTGISFYYKRKSYQIVYNDGATYKAPGDKDADRIEELTHNEISDPARVLYEQSTAAYGNVTPTKDGYIFAGWYDDELCTQKHDFVGTEDHPATMPAHNVTVYAKWIKTQYEVVLHDGSATGKDYIGQYETPTDVDYDGTVAQPDAKRDGYELIGWYTNEACTNPYTFTYHLNKDTEGTLGIDTDSHVDKNGTEQTYIKGQLNLYAKWRHVLDGASGITVVYDAGKDNTVNGDDQTYTDSTKYQDQATASATAAATYGGKDGLKFQYWELTKKDGTKVKVYPGDTFTVDYNDADRSVNTDASSKDKYVYTVTLKAVYDKGTPEQTQVIFDANKGTFGTADKDTKSYDVNTQITIPANPTRDGYDFLGWSGTQKDEWTQEDFDAATDVLDTSKTWLADNLDGLAWKSADGTNVLYACWKRKPVTLTIQKELEGAQANLLQTFSFTVTRDSDGATATVNGLGDPQGSNGAGQTATVSKLTKGGQEVELLWGDKVTITETDNTGYTTTYTTQLGTAAASGAQPGASVKDFQLNGNGKVVFTNTKDNVIVTGIKYAGVPGALTAVGAAALAIAGGFAYVRRDEAGTGAHARRRGRR